MMKNERVLKKGHFRYLCTMHEKWKEGIPSGKKSPLKNTMQKLEKRHLLGSHVLHPETISQ